jgi:hypothetical protein
MRSSEREILKNPGLGASKQDASPSALRLGSAHVRFALDGSQDPCARGGG